MVNNVHSGHKKCCVKVKLSLNLKILNLFVLVVFSSGLTGHDILKNKCTIKYNSTVATLFKVCH